MRAAPASMQRLAVLQRSRDCAGPKDMSGDATGFGDLNDGLCRAATVQRSGIHRQSDYHSPARGQ